VDVVSFEIRDPLRQLLANWSREALKSEVRSYTKNIEHEGEAFGTMTMVWDVTAHWRRSTGTPRHALAVLTALILLSVAILVALRWLVIKPVQQLNSRLVAPASGQIAARTRGSREGDRPVASGDQRTSGDGRVAAFHAFYIDHAGRRDVLDSTPKGCFFYANQVALRLLCCSEQQLRT